MFLPFLLMFWWCSFGVCCRRNRSQSCPFCRDCFKRMNSGDLWIYTDNTDIVDLTYIMRENLKRLFMYIDRLPLVIPDPVYVPYESHLGWELIHGLYEQSLYRKPSCIFDPREQYTISHWKQQCLSVGLRFHFLFLFQTGLCKSLKRARDSCLWFTRESFT